MDDEDSEDIGLISKTFNLISAYLDMNLPNVQQRLEVYRTALEKEFPKKLIIKERIDEKEAFNRLYKLGIKRVGAEAYTLFFMWGPLMLYALNLNGLAIVELHGLLEQFVIDEITGIILSSKEHTEILQKRLLRRKALPALAQILVDLKIWDKEDKKFAEELNTLRNAIAHKNAKQISDLAFSGKPIPYILITGVMTDFDCVSLIIRALHCLNKTLLLQIKPEDIPKLKKLEVEDEEKDKR